MWNDVSLQSLLLNKIQKTNLKGLDLTIVKYWCFWKLVFEGNIAYLFLKVWIFLRVYICAGVFFKQYLQALNVQY